MLVLSRRNGESLMISDDIKLKVLNIAEGQVRLGIEAPDDVEIWREEIYERIKAGKEVAKKRKLICI